jgi:hypothetical protein
MRRPSSIGNWAALIARKGADHDSYLTTRRKARLRAAIAYRDAAEAAWDVEAERAGSEGVAGIAG